MEQIFDGDARQETMGFARRSAGKVVSDFAPALEVPAAPIGVEVRCPSNGEGVHAVFVLEDVDGVEAILSA